MQLLRSKISSTDGVDLNFPRLLRSKAAQLMVSVMMIPTIIIPIIVFCVAVRRAEGLMVANELLKASRNEVTTGSERINTDST